MHLLDKLVFGNMDSSDPLMKKRQHAIHKTAGFKVSKAGVWKELRKQRKNEERSHLIIGESNNEVLER